MPTATTRRRTAWGNARTPYLTRFYTADQWTAANYARRINDLNARIDSGIGWLQTIASTDERHAKWTQKIASLRAERAVLQARLNALKLPAK